MCLKSAGLPVVGDSAAWQPRAGRTDDSPCGPVALPPRAPVWKRAVPSDRGASWRLTRGAEGTAWGDSAQRPRRAVVPRFAVFAGAFLAARFTFATAFFARAMTFFAFAATFFAARFTALRGTEERFRYFGS